MSGWTPWRWRSTAAALPFGSNESIRLGGSPAAAELPPPVPAAEAAGFAAQLLRERDALAQELGLERRRNARLTEDVMSLRLRTGSEDAAAWKRKAEQAHRNAAALSERLTEMRRQMERLEHELAWATGRSKVEPEVAR